MRYAIKKVEPQHAFDPIKLLADARRMEILRLLMASSATLTQLARTLGQSPAWVRHHILALESADLIELAETRTTGKVTEKFYRAKASALLLQEVILPKSKRPAVKTHSKAASLVGTAVRMRRLGCRRPPISTDSTSSRSSRSATISSCRANRSRRCISLDYLQTLAFRQSLSVLTGYNPTHTGEQILVH